MRAEHRVLQELERVLERRLRLLLEAFDEQPHCDLRRDLASDVPAHAVGHHEQQRVAAVGVCESVLIDLALTLAAFLEDREAPESCLATGSHLYDFAEQFLFQRVEERKLPLARRDVAERLLQRK